VKCGVWSAGGFPLEFPTISLGEVLMKPATMMFRNLMSPRPPHFARGYGRLFLDHVLQANEGCDFDFLRGRTPVRNEDTAGPSHT
jgi:hypothetical protein